MIFRSKRGNIQHHNRFNNTFFCAFILFLLTVCNIKTSHSQTFVSKQIFDYTGADQPLVIPACITQIKVKVWGAGGGGSMYNGQNAGGGAGGYAEGTIAVTPGDAFTMMVGEGGACDGLFDNISYGFGGAQSGLNYGGWGGGLSGVFTGTAAIAQNDMVRALLIAGGGGGSERDAPDTYCTSAGQGGDVTFGGGMPDMHGENGGIKSGGGGGGGYAGGLMTLRLSGNGIYYAGEGGTNYIHPIVSGGISLSSPDFGNWNTFPLTYQDAPNTTDSDHIPFVSSASPGIGTGSMYTFTKAGHGRIVVEFYSSPITASNDTLICEGNSATLTVSGGNAYIWNTGTTTASLTVSPATLATYTVTESSTGCIDSVTVSVNSKPTVTVNSESICPADTATLNANGAGTYVWSTGSTNGSITVSPLISSPYTVIGTLNGCKDTAIAIVTLFIPPAVDAGVNDSLCPGESASLSVTPNGIGYSYNWAAATGLNNATIYNPVASPAITTTYTVTVDDNNGCSSTDSVTVFVDTPMNSNQSISSASCYGICDGQAAVIINGGTSPYAYTWTGGCINSTCSNLCAGSYTVTITDAFGCSTVSDTIITEPNALIAAVTTSNPASCPDSCNGSATAIAIGGTAGSGYAYSWNTVPLQSTAAAANLCAGTYTCTITDANNCTSTTTATITEPNSMMLLSISSPTACNANTGMVSVDVTNGSGPLNYLWTPTGQTTALATSLASGDYTVTVTDANGCQATQAIVITVADNPIAATSAAAYTILEGNSTQLTATGGTSFQWSSESGLSCDTCAITAASPIVTTLYCVTVADTNGCTDSACITIRVEKPCPADYKVPNAFSPNNDGFNDNFCLKGWSNCVSDFSVLIFDRWGEKVFESNSPAFCWDGKYISSFKANLNENMNSAVFIYSIEAVLTDGTKLSRKGNISLLR